MRRQEHKDGFEDLYDEDHEDRDDDDEDRDEDDEDCDEDDVDRDDDDDEEEYQLSSSSIILAALNQSSLGIHSSNPTHHCGSR